MEKSEMIKGIIATVSPIVTTLNESYLKPKLVEILTKQKGKAKLTEYQLSNKLADYIAESYAKYSIINTIVFHNQQKLLKSLYIPLTVKNVKAQFSIDSYEEAFIPKYRKVLITDTAGMGKSTLMKRLFLSIVDQQAGIPVLIELRRLSKVKDIIDEIVEQISTLTQTPEKGIIQQLVSKGDFIFLLDGFDEVPLPERKSVTKQIQDFIAKAGNNCFVLTSRPESALASFGDFIEFKISPLNRAEAHELLERYDDSGKLYKTLIKKLKEPQYDGIKDFLANPLLVSLLYAAFEHKHTIPLKKHIFYRQVYDALFESHDLTKGDSFTRDKYSNLDIDEFHRVLRHLGYNCLIKGKIEYEKDELLSLIKSAKEYCVGVNFKDSDFLKDILNTVPLFSMDGIYYKWSHKSLQEYFAAQFIFLDSKEKQKRILIKLSKHHDLERFYNLLDIYYTLDYKAFKEIIIYNLLKDYFSYIKESYKVFKNDGKKIRQIITFTSDFILIKKSFNQEEGKIASEIFTCIRQSIGRELKGWSIAIRNTDEPNLNHIKVARNIKPAGKMLQFLLTKKENFVKEVRESRTIEDVFELNLEESKVYLVDEDQSSILNKDSIFNLVNSIIIKYNAGRLLCIDESEGGKTLRSLEQALSSTNNDNLLDF